MRAHSLFVASLLLAACARSNDTSKATERNRPASSPTAKPATPTAGQEAVGYFAGGCFWGVEHYMEQLEGVLSVESGYMGGHVDDPSYGDVQGEDSGHLEAVRVRFDPTRISYREVAKRFFEIHDPTQEDGQGPDIGPEYRSAVFYADQEQEKIARDLIGILEQRGYDVATELRQADQFWQAEDYHQDYYEKHDKTPYCHARVKRFGD